VLRAKGGHGGDSFAQLGRRGLESDGHGALAALAQVAQVAQSVAKGRKLGAPQVEQLGAGLFHIGHKGGVGHAQQRRGAQQRSSSPRLVPRHRFAQPHVSSQRILRGLATHG
jgi:hypothetical protein